MKKYILKAFCLLCLSGTIFPQARNSFNGARVSVLPPTVKNINEVALSDMVAKKIEGNFSMYTDFTLITSNVAEIRKIQRQSEDLSFDESTAIEAGKLLSVQYVLSSDIAKIGSEYSFSCSFTNVTTGETKSFGPFNRKTINELYSVSGSAVDEMTIKLCDNLGIPLTNSQKYVLTHGEADLSVSDQRKLNQEDMDNYKRQLEELTSQINALQFSSDFEVKQRLEAERALAEEKLNAAKSKEQRLLEDERKRAEDEKEDAKRNEEQKKKRNKMEKEAEEKIRQLREKRMESATILQQLSMIESKKKALVEIREDVEALVEESNDALQKELDAEIQSIQDKPYRPAELDANGNLTEKARKIREGKQQKIEDEYNGNNKTKGKKKDAEEKIRSATIRQEYDLYNEIISDYEKIKKTQTLTSASENADLRYSIGVYDGSSYSWQAQLFVYSDGVLLWQYDMPLSYKKLTGKDPDPDDDEKLEEYYDLVDLYISWFMRDSPILTFELDYNIEAYPDDTPSTYRFNFTQIQIKETVSGKRLDTIHLKNASIVRTMTPVYDIRTIEEQKRAEAEKQRQKLAAEQAQEEKLQREQEAQERKRYLRRKNRERMEKNMRFMGMGANPYSTAGGFEGFDVDFNLTFKMNDSKTAKGYMGVTFGMVQTPDIIKDVISPAYMFEFATSFGVLLHSTMRYSPNLYVQGGVGLVAAKTRGTWMYHYTSKDDYGNETKKEEEKKSATYVLTKFTAGLDFPLAKHFGLYAQGTLNLIVTGRDEKPVNTTFSAQAGFSIF
ncbi:MAG: hypothetical protein K2M50_07270 [Treponemataceae bacterium]|nr:hypothetical protein [Treponemataceae bacterium]